MVECLLSRVVIISLRMWGLNDTDPLLALSSAAGKGIEEACLRKTQTTIVDAINLNEYLAGVSSKVVISSSSYRRRH